MLENRHTEMLINDLDRVNDFDLLRMIRFVEDILRRIEYRFARAELFAFASMRHESQLLSPNSVEPSALYAWRFGLDWTFFPQTAT